MIPSNLNICNHIELSKPYISLTFCFSPACPHIAHVSLTNEHCASLIDELRSAGSDANRVGMARFGIATERAFGTGMPVLRTLAKVAGKNHELASALWDSGWHEARILAALVDVPSLVTREQMDSWTGEFNSWDLCDQCCSNLFSKTPHAEDMIRAWAVREEEFVKRAAFALLASLAVHSRTMSREDFIALLPLIENAASDERNFVKKAVNWALRQIGKRSLALHSEAIACAERLVNMESRSARWIARDALRELHSEATIQRIANKKPRSGSSTLPRH
jgi:3-methyladenine DNA glycosylase AlkD